MNTKILIIEDKSDVADIIAASLKSSGNKVLTAVDGETGLAKARAIIPDLVILDLMLPKLNGMEVCKLLKQTPVTAAIPIIMLTAKSDEIDRVLGFELGADDYVTKPFSPRELSLRVRALLRRRLPEAGKPEYFKNGELTLDLDRHEVKIGAERLVLSATEFKLLSILMARKGRVLSRERLLNEVWGYETDIATRTVDTHIRRLRKKMTDPNIYIETMRGVGYRMPEAD